jgi:YXWGXW repeat-containing protein
MVTKMRTASLICVLLIGMAFLAMPVNSQAQVAVGVSIRVGPPPLPVYVQPVCPGPGFIWTPGYWAYGPDGYYWVPGTWVEPPVVGVLWTPGYWGWRGGFYVWNPGYWGPHVGFYGGINYGFGYTGVGFVGGFWRGGVYHYNTAVTRVDTTIIHNTYRTTVINNTVNRTSFNGGEHGIHAEPNRAERAAMTEHHVGPTSLQEHHQHEASSHRDMLASVNHGRPSVAASSKPGQFTGHGVVAANKGGNSNYQKFNGNNGGSANNNGKFNKDSRGFHGGNNAGNGNSGKGSFNKNASTAYKGGNNGGNNSSKFNKTYNPNNKVASSNPHGSNVRSGGQQHPNEAHSNERRDHR